jgi:DNA-binding HxlR family transcriptional regulator
MGSAADARRYNSSDGRSSAGGSLTTSLNAGVSEAAQRAVDLLARKWVIKIVAALAEGPLRQFQLRAALSSVQSKVLRETLHMLEQQGLVERVLCRDEVGGAAVAYRLTDVGESLGVPIEAIADWANLKLPRVDGLREVTAEPLLAEGA